MTQLRNMFRGYLTLVAMPLETLSVRREEGQTLAEYALILALIAVVVVGVVAVLGGKISDLFTSVASSI